MLFWRACVGGVGAMVLGIVALAGPESDPLDRMTPVPANEPVPVADFFRPWLLRQPELNATGTHFAALVSTGSDSTDLLLGDLTTRKFFRQNGNDVQGQDVAAFEWMDERHLLFTISEEKRYAHSVWSLEIGERGLKAPKQLVRNRLSTPLGASRNTPLQPLLRIQDKDASKVIRIDARRAINDKTHVGVERTRTANYGEILASYEQPPGDRAVWYGVDRAGDLAFSVAVKDGVSSLYRLDGRSWQRCPVDLDQVEVLAVGDVPGELIVLGPRPGVGPRLMQRLDASTGSLGEVLHRDEQYEPAEVRFHRRPTDGQVLGISYSRKTPCSVWFDPAYSQMQAELEQALPNTFVRIEGGDRLEKRYFVSVRSDREPPKYYYFNREAHSLAPVMSAAPWIDPGRMNAMRGLTYKSRDGIAIDAYLTLPAGASREFPPPLVVMPHGGPWVRDTWGWNARVQFLASRGYAVFQPNYRGSASYDWRFPAEDQWAFRKMHDDVTDGVQMLIRSGLVDGRRVAIMGGSFGGYLALCGAVFEPELYRCAITIAGVFDWELLMKANRRDDNRAAYGRLRRWLGDPGIEREKFESISPLRHVDRIKIPVYVAHGDADRTVPVAQSEGLVEQLRKYGVPYEVQIERDEAHGFRKLDDQVELHSRIEAFLAKNLAPWDGAKLTPQLPAVGLQPIVAAP